MSNRPLRKRIPYRKPIGEDSLPKDLEFVANKSSLRAKKIVVIDHNLTIEVWFNAHYFERYYFGDGRGKREGIEPETVESLVTRSIAHLFWYSTVVRGFSFINKKTGAEYANRIVVQEAMNTSMLNVVIEIHFLGLNKFEITVITAMVVDNFKIASGQFCIEVQQKLSILKKIDDGKVLDLYSIPFA